MCVAGKWTCTWSTNLVKREDLSDLADARKAPVDGDARVRAAKVGQVLHLLAELQAAVLRERLLVDHGLQVLQHLLRCQVDEHLAVLRGHLALLWQRHMRNISQKKKGDGLASRFHKQGTKRVSSRAC